MWDFYYQPQFCGSNFTSCIRNQLSDLITQPQYHATSAFGPFSGGDLENSTGAWLPRLRITGSAPSTLSVFYDGNDMVTETNIVVDAASLGITIRQPSLQADSVWLLSPIQDPQIRRVGINVTNLGDLASLIFLELGCDAAVSVTFNSTAIAINTSAIIFADITIATPLVGVTVHCNGQVGVGMKPYWNSSGKNISLPTLILPTETNGCWMIPPPSSLFANSQAWASANLSNIFTSTGLLGPNPSHLNATGSWLVATPKEYWTIAQFSELVIGSLSTYIVRLNAACSSSIGSFISSSADVSLPANTSLPCEYDFGITGSNADVTWNCYLNMTIIQSPCAASRGSSLLQPFQMLVPASPCFAGAAEPSLFLTVSQWIQQSSVSPRTDLMTISQSFGWTPRPTSAGGWQTLGFGSVMDPTPFVFLSQISSSVINGGNASGTVDITATCDNSVVLSVPLSTASCTLSPGQACSLLLTFITNDSSIAQLVPSCVIVLQISIPQTACWSNQGKTYLQQYSLSSSSVPASPPNHTDKGLLGIGKGASAAVIAVIVIVGLALLIVLGALLLRGYFRNRSPKPPRSVPNDNEGNHSSYSKVHAPTGEFHPSGQMPLDPNPGKEPAVYVV